MLRFLGKLVLLLATLLFGFLMVLVLLSVFAPTALRAFGYTPSFVRASNMQSMVFHSITRLSMLLGPLFLLGFLFCLALVAWRVLAHEKSREAERRDVEGSRTMQELYQGLSRLEERVEALETILLERARRTRTPERRTGVGQNPTRAEG